MKTLIKLISLLIIVFLLGSGCKKRHEMLNNNVSPHDFLSTERFNKLTLEINYISGYEPSPNAVGNVVDFLNNRLHKPGGIEVIKRAVQGIGGLYYDINDIKNIELNNRKEVTRGSRLTVYMLFLDKDYINNQNSNAKVLGMQYGSSSIVMFENQLRNFSGGFAEPSLEVLETAVSEHEFGHIMGLVDNGTAMQQYHQDENHGHHCNNKNCLMYYEAETSDFIANLVGGKVPDLDENCVNDLRANGGR